MADWKPVAAPRLPERRKVFEHTSCVTTFVDRDCVVHVFGWVKLIFDGRQNARRLL